MRVQHRKPTWNWCKSNVAIMNILIQAYISTPAFRILELLQMVSLTVIVAEGGWLRSNAHSSIEKSIHTDHRSKFLSQETWRWRNSPMWWPWVLLQIQGQLAVCNMDYSWLHLITGLHVACTVNEISQIQNTSLISQSQLSMNFLLLFCFLDCSLVHPPLWRNLQPKIMLLTLIAGVVEKMRGKWWPVIMHRVKENGSTYGV